MKFLEAAISLLSLASAQTYSFIPPDWNMNPLWKDQSHCTFDSSSATMFELTVDRTDLIATRDGC